MHCVLMEHTYPADSMSGEGTLVTGMWIHTINKTGVQSTVELLGQNTSRQLFIVCIFIFPSQQSVLQLLGTVKHLSPVHL